MHKLYTTQMDDDGDGLGAFRGILSALIIYTVPPLLWFAGRALLRWVRAL